MSRFSFQVEVLTRYTELKKKMQLPVHEKFRHKLKIFQPGWKYNNLE